jgi:hypothetical protein
MRYSLIDANHLAAAPAPMVFLLRQKLNVFDGAAFLALEGRPLCFHL